MAAFFQSFRSSTMPKRLLRYALARLDLLDAEALDMENLDFALGRNTVFEFRDVGIILKKLEKLLKLPPGFTLQKAKVLLLRVTIPMDFYTSPITVEVDGVDVRLKLESAERKLGRMSTATTQEGAAIVPNTVDLAQSFLETQPSSERQKLEEALAAETQDLAASISVSDDGSEDEHGFGTGQALSLPVFLADFLQGIVDRVQIKIKGVTFQLDMEVPLEVNSPNPEPVSFQIVLEGIDVEGITAQVAEAGTSPTIITKEGKRHVSLANIRAYLITEANVFSVLSRSPSMASPSATSSPTMTRNPPSRETTSLAERSLGDLSVHSQPESLREHLSSQSDLYEGEDDLLTDSEDALGIPYDFTGAKEELDDESPATPRASVYHEPNPPLDESIFLSTTLEAPPEHSTVFQDSVAEQSAEPEVSSSSTHTLPVRPAEIAIESINPDGSVGSIPVRREPVQPLTEDLCLSQIYTHEDAESMYMSAFSQADPPQTALSHPMLSEPLPQTIVEPPKSPTEQSPTKQSPPEQSPPEQSPPEQPRTPKTVMPGAWGDDSDGSPQSERDPFCQSGLAAPPPAAGESEANGSDSSTSSPAFSRASLANQDEGVDQIGEREAAQQDDVATPRGPTRVVKEIMQLDNISIYIPSHHQHIQVHAASADSVSQLYQSMGQSMYPQAPGAFSIHKASSTLPQSPPIPSASPEEGDNALEVTLSPLTINFDASLGFLLAMVAGRLSEVLKPQAPVPPVQPPTETDTKKASEVKVTLQDVSIKFLNRLGGVADTSERYLAPSAFTFDQEVLLSASLQNLTLSVAPTEFVSSAKGKGQSENHQGTLTKIDIEKFRFGYANGDIISFDNGRPMSTSVRDTFLSTGYDIGVKIIQSGDKVRTDVETLPLVFQLDLQRLDETFSWFGGLSGFLNMSASITSSPPPTAKSTPLPLQKPRGVRFEAPIDPNDKSAASQNKVNVRIGGALLELMGKECSVVAESNAIKLVSRDEGIGMACSMIRIFGPYLENSSAEPAITAEIASVRLDFLLVPKEPDLEKLLELILPSKVKFDNEGDEIMVDTLLRQRRKGSVLRTNIDSISVRVKNMAQLVVLPNLGEEIAKLSTVAKYLPEDDRPGLLTFVNIQKLSVGLDFGGRIGHIGAEIRDAEVGHISVPSLVAVAVHGISVKRNKTEEIVSSSALDSSKKIPSRGPVLVGRMIGDEIEPAIKLRLQDVSVEYRVPTIMDILGLAEDATPQDFEASLAASVANLGDQAHTALVREPVVSADTSKASKPMTLDVGFRDCLVGLNPLNLPSKMVVVFTDAHLEVALPKDDRTKAAMRIKKASILLTDDASQTPETNSHSSARQRSYSAASPQVAEICSRGFVDICYISSAKVVASVAPGSDGDKMIDIELHDDLLVLETCADSTQTLITLANALKPPTPPSKENKYRTNVVPVEDMLASISAEAFGKPEGEYDFDMDFAGAQEMAGSGLDADDGSDNSLHIESQYYGDVSQGEEIFDAMKSSGLSHGTSMQDTNEGVLLTGFHPSVSDISEGSGDLVIHENFYSQGPTKTHSAKVWNSNKNTYDRAPDDVLKRSPVKVSVRNVHVIWNLFDGYDWNHTRDVISKAVQDIEARANERQAHMGGPQFYEEEIGDEAIGDFLFNSIYIGVSANHDPHELSRAINEGLNDNATETESIATTTVTTTTNRTARRNQPRSKRLRLNRSRHHKITFELQGVNVDIVAYPPGEGETQSCIDVRVQTLDVFDHVPTSTWKKFATYDQDQGERELDTSMVHLEILNVRPIPELVASEIVMRATVLPLRLHVDQDALDFITRFFEFKDEKTPVHSSPSDIPFLQRAEVNNIQVKLDFKPKRVDYAGLRSGHTTEFMNFIVLEEARMVMRHVIIYGVSGFDRLGKTLNDIWMPDVRNNQLPGVVAGLAPVRSLVNIGSGFRSLVEIPIMEYKKDGRVIRSLSKGAASFARQTGIEIVKLGAKLAVGTQYALQGAEDMLTEKRQMDGDWEDDDLDAEDKKQISLYADQPTGVIQGIRGGYRSLTRDVMLARDAIIAVPGEVMESQSAGGAAKAVLRRAPTIIFRPAVGVTKVIGQTLMGATNTIDPQNKRRIDEKYKH